jgi:hypothetical protein
MKEKETHKRVRLFSRVITGEAASKQERRDSFQDEAGNERISHEKSKESTEKTLKSII